MMYLNQVNFDKILILRHNMDVTNIFHISSPRLNPREIVCTSAEREEMLKERKKKCVRGKKGGGSCESELERICNIAVIN